MWYHPATFDLTWRDVVGAWLVCLAIGLISFGY
jgi:energy-coupling factor transporter transmembrane protein EcfT